MQRTGLRWVMAGLIVSAVGCPEPEEEPELVGVEVTPDSVEVPAGQHIQLTVTGTWSDDSTSDLTNDVEWLTADPEEAVVDDSGRVDALAEGQATITATIDLFAASALVTVGPPILDVLISSPLAFDLAAGQSAPVVITGRFGDGSLQDLTSSVTWSSSDVDVAYAESGMVFAGEPGSAEIVAVLDGEDVEIPVEVSDVALVFIDVDPSSPAVPLGNSLQMIAIGTWSDGSTSDITTESEWTTSDPSHLSFDPAQPGLVDAVGAGGAVLQASRLGVRGETTGDVVDADLVDLDITPADFDMPLGGSFALSLTGTFSDGSEEDLTDVADWSSDDPLVATASNDAGTRGVASAVDLGSTVVWATIGDLSALSVATVGDAELVSLALDPVAPSTPLGVEQELALIGTWTDGSVLDHTAAADWTTDDELIAVFDIPGIGTPVAVGTATVTATFGDLEATTLLTVLPAELLVIGVTPPVDTVGVGAQAGFEATGTFSDGTVTDLTTTAFWGSSAPGFATVSNLFGEEGVATAEAVGTTTILASQDSVSGAAVLHVVEAQPSSLAIEPDAPTLTVGDELILTATATLTDGSEVDVTAEAAWSSDTPTVATTSNDSGLEGTLTGVGEGTAVVTATYGAVFQSVTVTVDPP